MVPGEPQAVVTLWLGMGGKAVQPVEVTPLGSSHAAALLVDPAALGTVLEGWDDD